MSKSRGFTLIELLVIIAIIGILAAILLPTLACGARSASVKAVPLFDAESWSTAMPVEYFHRFC